MKTVFLGIGEKAILAMMQLRTWLNCFIQQETSKQNTEGTALGSFQHDLRATESKGE